jgi:hypothetical protein
MNVGSISALHGELQVSPGLPERLEQISSPTVRRILRRITQDEPHLPPPEAYHGSLGRPSTGTNLAHPMKFSPTISGCTLGRDEHLQ